MRFEWDEAKNQANIRKHGVDFRDAAYVFSYPFALNISDDEHSDDEERWVIMGVSHRQRLLVVVHTEDDDRQIVRIISARPADPDERRQYEEGHSRRG